MTYLDFVHNIECILESRVREGYLDQCVCCSVHRGRRAALKGVTKVGLGIFDLGVAPKDD
jgi:hypothetical protein